MGRTGQRYGKRWSTLPHKMTDTNGCVLGRNSTGKFEPVLIFQVLKAVKKNGNISEIGHACICMIISVLLIYLDNRGRILDNRDSGLYFSDRSLYSSFHGFYFYLIPLPSKLTNQKTYL